MVKACVWKSSSWWARQGRADPSHAEREESGRYGVSVAESALVPPGPIPNPVVTRRSAGEYYGGDFMGGEAAAGTPYRHDEGFGQVTRGGAVAARWAHNPKVGGSNPSPATRL